MRKTEARNETKKWQGSKWIRQDKRLAIYLRDGLACCYCGYALEEGAQLSLDHLCCRSNGGSNGAENLVTCCEKCNKSRGIRSVKSFCGAVAHYTDRSAADILRHVRSATRRNLAKYRAEAREMIDRRGSYAAAMDR